MEQGIQGYSPPPRARQQFRRELIKGHAPGRWTEPREVWTLYFACSSFMQNKASMLVLALFNLQFIENS